MIICINRSLDQYTDTVSDCNGNPPSKSTEESGNKIDKVHQ